MPDDRIREEIRSRVDIVEIVGDYVTLKRAGANYSGLCPFHDDKHPSFTVSPRHQSYRCWSCGARGDVFKFLMELEKLTFPEAMKRLAERAGVRYEPKKMTPEQVTARDRQYDLHREAARMFHDLLVKSPAAQHARDYLTRRGVTAEAIVKFQLGFAPESWEATLRALQKRGFTLEEIVRGGLAVSREEGSGAYDRFRNRLMFPIWEVQGKVIAFGGRTLADEPAKYLNSPETLLFVKGQTRYGLHLATSKIRERDATIVCEGYLDLIALHQHGFEHSVATMGTAFTTANLSALKRLSPNLFACFDGDSAGLNAVLNSAPLFEQQEMNVHVIGLPAGDDPDTFLRTRGREAFAERLAQALPLVDYRIERLAAGVTVRDEASRQALVRAVMPVLAQIHEHTILEGQVVKIAQQWAGGDLRRAQSIELALKQEVARQRGRQRTGAVPTPAQGGPPDAVPSPPARVPGYVVAERQLLAHALHDLSAARKLFATFFPRQFADECNREIATALATQLPALQENELNPADARRFVEELPPSSRAVASDLLLVAEPLDERALQKIVRELEARRERRQRIDRAKRQSS